MSSESNAVIDVGSHVPDAIFEEEVDAGPSPKRVCTSTNVPAPRIVYMGSPPVPVDLSKRKVMSAAEFHQRYKVPIKCVSMNQQNRKRELLQQQTEQNVHARLSSLKCELDSLTCRVRECGRCFESVRVLAWHMSYSHTDHASPSPPMCYVCGQTMKSIKGKNSHLVSAHRDLSVLHNAQCVDQSVSISAQRWFVTPVSSQLSRVQCSIRKVMVRPARPLISAAPDLSPVIVVDVGSVHDLQVGSNCRTDNYHHIDS